MNKAKLTKIIRKVVNEEVSYEGKPLTRNLRKMKLTKIGDMWLTPKQLPDELRKKFEDCERKGKNKVVGGEDQCFTVKKEGKFIAVKIGDMWLTPEQLPDELRKKFEDCERKGKNKVDEPVEPHEGEKKNNIWPDYVWKKGSREQEGKRNNFGPDYVWRKGSSEGGRVVTREVGRGQQVKK